MTRMMSRLPVALAFCGLAFLAVVGAAFGQRRPGDQPSHDVLAALSVQDQRAALLTLIQASGGSCEGLSGAYFAGIDAAGLAYWDARCRDRTAWRIALPRDGGAAAVTVCPREIGTCFVPVPQTAGDTGATRQARCSAACELRSGPARRTCIAECLQGTDAIAGVGGSGNDRHISVFVADFPLMTQGFLAGGRAASAAQDSARSACSVVAGAQACRLVVSAMNRCVAVVLSPDGLIATGTGIELDDAKREANTACGHGGACQLVVSGC